MIKPIGIATEDVLSEAVAIKIINSVTTDFTVVLTLGKKGNGYLKSKLYNFNQISRQHPFLVLTDLDDSPCPLHTISNWITTPLNPQLIFRIAVREVESWLLADRDAIASFLGVSVATCPNNPDTLHDPKQEILRLARRSSKREIKQDLLPIKGATSPVGLGYNLRLLDFIHNHWDVSKALTRSDSLNRAWKSINTLPA